MFTLKELIATYGLPLTVYNINNDKLTFMYEHQDFFYGHYVDKKTTIRAVCLKGTVKNTYRLVENLREVE